MAPSGFEIGLKLQARLLAALQSQQSSRVQSGAVGIAALPKQLLCTEAQPLLSALSAAVHRASAFLHTDNVTCMLMLTAFEVPPPISLTQEPCGFLRSWILDRESQRKQQC